MLRKKHARIATKFLHLFLSCALIFQSLAPIASVYAQEATPEPTPEVQTTPEPTPTLEATVVEPTPEITPAQEVTPTPTSETTPTPITEVTPIPEPTSAPELNTTQTTTETALTETIDLSSPESQTSAQLNPTLTTDKADYSPTDTVIITGADYQPNTTYTIVISSHDEPAARHEASVTTDANGNLYYSYQLDGTYRPNYQVEIFLGTVLVTSTTFTDTASPALNWPTDWTTPNCNQDISDESPSQLDILGDALHSGAYYQKDSNYLYLRERIEGNPLQNSGHFTQHNWVVVDDQNGDGFYEYLFSLNGKDEKVQIWKKNSSTTPIDWTPIFNDPADIIVWEGTTNDYAKVEAADSGYWFVYWAIPLSHGEFTLSQNAILYFTTSADANNANKDHLNCYEDPTGSITVVKDSQPNDPQDFTFSMTGQSNFFLDDDSDNALNNSQTFTDLQAGNYSINEINLPLGWTVTGASCTGGNDTDPTNITLESNENLICTFINTKKGNIIVEKQTNPDGDPQSFSFTTSYDQDGFSLTDGQQNDSGYLSPNTYSVSEALPDGWTQTSATCSDGSPINAINLSAGETITCTFVNTKSGSITVEKQTNPNGSSQQFTFSGELSGNISDGGQLSKTLQPGSYTVTEVLPSGWELAQIECNDQNSSGNLVTKTVTFNLEAGENIKCTFTNNELPTLEVKKQIVDPLNPNNDDLFNLLIGGIEYATNVGNNGTTGVKTLAPSSYSISETAGTNANLNDYNVTIIGTGCDWNTTLNYGDHKVCTIVNTRKTATISLDKIVIGGTANDLDWFFTILNQQGTYYDGNQILLNTGIYAISESTGVLGYTATAVGGICTQLNGSSATLTVGDQSGTCSFTNTRDTGSVRVNKLVDTNGDGQYEGGNDVANTLGFRWELDSENDNRLMGTNASGITTTVAGTTHTITEELAPNYHFVGWYSTGSTQYSCTNPQGTTLPININVVKDTETEITLCNALDTAHITLIKNVITNNGGQAGPNDFGLSLGGQSVLSGVSTQVNANEDIALNEAGLFGYNFVSITGAGCPSDLGGIVNLNNGESITCTITNDDEAASLTVIKHVINDNGGLLNADDFTMNVTGTNVSDPSFPGDENGTTVTLNAGSYSVDETNVDGYTKSFSNECNGSIAVGETRTCTITNDDEAASLTVIKHVINDNGGLLEADDFIMNVTATNPSDASFPGSESGSTVTLDAGSYSVDEGNHDGYNKLLGANCSGTIANGESKTCTITNDDQTATLIVRKVVVDSNASPATFSFKVNDGSSTQFEADGENQLTVNAGTYNVVENPASDYTTTYDNCSDIVIENGGTATCTITNTVKRGSIQGRKYNDVNGNGDFDDNEKIDTNRLDGWTINLYSDSQLTNLIASMETGDDTTPAGDVEKGQYRFENLLPGTYYVCETPKSNWLQTEPKSGIQHSNGTYCHTVTVAAGQPVDTIQFGNFQEGHISGHKWNDLDGDKIWDLDEEGIEDWTIYALYPDQSIHTRTTTGSGYYNFGDLGPGQYTIYESLTPQQLADGWTQTYPENPSSYTIDMVSNGDFENYDFGNVRLLDLHGYKWHDLNANHQEDEFNLLSGWTINLSKQNSNGIYELVDSMETDDSIPHYGWYWFEDLLPGNYKICEELETGWQQTFPQTDDGCHYVTLPDDNTGGLPELLNAVAGPGYNFGNVQLASITIEKQTLDETDETFDFTLNGDATGSATLGDGESKTFDNLLPGTYSLSEGDLSGWELDDVSCTTNLDKSAPDYQNINLDPGEDVVCTFTNAGLPSLTITKNNDRKGETLGVNEIVTYTIEVTNTGKVTLTDVYVEDSQPIQEYFDYLEDSGKLTDPDGNVTAVTASGTNPYRWEIGTIEPGDTFTLTYQIKILNTNINGSHYNLAFAAGQTDREESETIYSDIVEDPFAIGSASNPSTDITTPEGQVLGAATGTPSLFAIFGLLLLALGLVLKFNKKLLKVLPVYALAFIFVTGAHAVEPENPVKVQMVDLPGYKNQDNFEISYTAQSINGIKNVRLEYKRDGIDWTTLTILTSTSGKFQLSGSQINQDGSYSFRATATDNNDNTATDEVSTTVDRHHPPTPESFSKERKFAQQYILRWYNPDSDQEYRVIIYRSDKPEFTADNNTQIAVINVTRKTNSEWQNDTPTDKSYYYAIRTIDPAGNISGLATDQDIQTSTSSTSTEGTPAGNETFEGKKLEAQQGTGTGGQILGDEATESGDENNQDLTNEEIDQLLKEAQDDQKSSFPWPLVVVGLGFAAVLYFIFVRR